MTPNTEPTLLDVLERAVFSEYDRAYQQYYRGEVDNSAYLEDLEQGMEFLAVLQDEDNIDSLIRVYRNQDDPDFEAILQTTQKVLDTFNSEQV
jgi:hypothetical protein